MSALVCSAESNWRAYLRADCMGFRDRDGGTILKSPMQMQSSLVRRGATAPGDEHSKASGCWQPARDL